MVTNGVNINKYATNVGEQCAKGSNVAICQTPSEFELVQYIIESRNAFIVRCD